MSISSKSILYALVLVFCSGQIHAGSFSGQLVRALSGDTVEIRHDGRFESVRLAQIYAPVEGQPFGTAARNFIWRSAGNKTVTVRYDEYDLRGNAVGEVFLEDGSNLNKLIVAAGYAWEYKGYSYDEEYGRLEAAARRAKTGLWAVKDPIQPWEWRWLQAKADSLRRSGNLATVCAAKSTCGEMADCEEAKFYMYACGLTRLDKDGNGIPCEVKCENETFQPPLEIPAQTAALPASDTSERTEN